MCCGTRTPNSCSWNRLSERPRSGFGRTCRRCAERSRWTRPTRPTAASCAGEPATPTPTSTPAPAEPDAGQAAFKSLRKVTYGGSVIAPSLLRLCMEQLGCELAQMYAAAESGSGVTCLTAAEHWPDNPKLASVGRPCPGNEIKIVNHSGEVLPAGQAGQICVRTPANFIEYWHHPAATTELLVDGWLRMPDAGYLDDDGYLFVLDRMDDAIIVAGQNIYPAEVELA